MCLYVISWSSAVIMKRRASAAFSMQRRRGKELQSQKIQPIGLNETDATNRQRSGAGVDAIGELFHQNAVRRPVGGNATKNIIMTAGI
jgi:hypothetical protein